MDPLCSHRNGLFPRPILRVYRRARYFAALFIWLRWSIADVALDCRQNQMRKLRLTDELTSWCIPNGMYFVLQLPISPLEDSLNYYQLRFMAERTHCANTLFNNDAEFNSARMEQRWKKWHTSFCPAVGYTRGKNWAIHKPFLYIIFLLINFELILLSSDRLPLKTAPPPQGREFFCCSTTSCFIAVDRRWSKTCYVMHDGTMTKHLILLMKRNQ